MFLSKVARLGGLKFTISKIQFIIPITYKIMDLNGEEIQGSNYEQELQKATHDMFRIENNILRRRQDKYLVYYIKLYSPHGQHRQKNNNKI